MSVNNAELLTLLRIEERLESRRGQYPSRIAETERLLTLVRARILAVVACRCEHMDHFDGGPLHPYGSVPSGTAVAQHVGPVCDTCANTCMHVWLIKEES